MRNAIIVAGLLLAACSRPAPTTDAANSMGSAGSVDQPPGNAVVPAENAATPEPVPTPETTAAKDAFLGHWIGVEGMFLNVTERTGGGVTLEMQWDLDHKGSFPGTIEADGIHFTRDGVAEVARPSDGDATGLKYLAGKADCLTVKSGEGYCRK